ncbi:terminase small subunit [Roseovarius marisflavi]|uniref:terminase small subunit n=1 Tax=Roseovarius marisflavi TaxID=1054996 RepID=UPI0009343530
MARKPAAPKKAPAKKQTRKAPAGKAAQKAPTGLTKQQEHFCRSYVVHHNGARPARDAGYSANTAREQAYDLLTNTHIQRLIQKLQKECAERLQIEQDQIADRLWRTVTGDVNDLVQVSLP